LTDALVTAGIIGIDEAMEQPILNKAFHLANRMLAQWQHERYMVYALQDYNVVSTGAISYTVGYQQQFNINPRPDRLEYSFLRQPNSNGAQPFDWPLEIINAHEDYAAIRIKTLGTFSNAIFYDPQWPVGFLLPWPVPQASIYELHILVKQTLNQFSSLQQALYFPPEYEACIEWNMVRRLKAAFQMPPDPTINELAAQAKEIIRKANFQVPTLKYPRELRRPGDRAYDYRSDTW
jgi:hypothetical protein